MGLWAFSSVRIIVSMFYAFRDTKTPVITALISFLANIVLSLLLMMPLKHGGLALATSLSSMINVALLLLALDIKIGYLGLRRLKKSVLKIAACSLIMGGIVWGLASFIIHAENLSFRGQLSGVTCCILAGIVSYAVLSFLFKSPEIKSLVARAGRGIKKGD